MLVSFDIHMDLQYFWFQQNYFILKNLTCNAVHTMFRFGRPDLPFSTRSLDANTSSEA